MSTVLGGYVDRSIKANGDERQDAMVTNPYVLAGYSPPRLCYDTTMICTDLAKE